MYFTFLTPPVTDIGIEKIKKILPLINEEKFEICVNDFGVLELLRKINYKGKVVLGRLLDKLPHDNRMHPSEYSSYTSVNGLAYMQLPAYSATYFKKILEKYRVYRSEFDLPPQGIHLGNTLNCHNSLYAPYGYLTTGRNCLFRNMDCISYSGFDLNNRGVLQKKL